MTCKNCRNTHTVKNGFGRGKQRDKCHACGYTFVLGDARHSHATEIKKALAIILYALGKSSFGFLGKLVMVHLGGRVMQQGAPADPGALGLAVRTAQAGDAARPRTRR